MNLINPRTIAGTALFFILLIYGMAWITDIEPGEVGLTIKKIGSDKGILPETLDTGMHMIEPFMYDVAVYDTRLKQYQLDDIPASTKDGQPILVDMSVELGLVDKNVPTLHENIGRDYYNQVVYPALRSTLRNTTTQELSDEIYTGDGRISIQNTVQKAMRDRTEPLGMRITINLREITFQNQQFVEALEEKAKAQQKVEIERRNAEAAVNTAKKVENIAEGEKQKRIKAAEAQKEEIRLKGLGERLAKEQEAKGNLALYRAEAEGTRLQVNAFGSGATYASVKWAENMGPNVKVYGIPTGSPGTTSLMDLNGILKGAFTAPTTNGSK